MFFLCASRCCKNGAIQKNGSIVNIASISAYDGPARGIHYAASKGGLISMTSGLSNVTIKELYKGKCYSTGLTDTAQPRDGHSEAEIKEMGNSLPLGRIIQPV